MAKTFIITLDGPAGVGKSTLAKRIAAELGVAYLDTGAMFRTIAMAVFKQEPPVSEDKIPGFLSGFKFILEGCGGETVLSCNGRRVGNEIRTEEAGMLAARAGKMPVVREYLKIAQQRLGADFSLVAEGRDMGTVVFPDARCKIFLDARPEIRAARRLEQLKSMGQEADLDELARQIALRDEEDRNRPIAPLRPAEDAVIIDTSKLDIHGVFDACMAAVREHP